jgi:hypothetical protein
MSDAVLVLCEGPSCTWVENHHILNKNDDPQLHCTCTTCNIGYMCCRHYTGILFQVLIPPGSGPYPNRQKSQVGINQPEKDSVVTTSRGSMEPTIQSKTQSQHQVDQMTNRGSTEATSGLLTTSTQQSTNLNVGAINCS